MAITIKRYDSLILVGCDNLLCVNQFYSDITKDNEGRYMIKAYCPECCEEEPLFELFIKELKGGEINE